MTSLVLPMYNPGSVVERTWHAVRQFLGLRPDSWEIIFVADGCTDGSPDRLAELIKSNADNRIRLIQYRPNHGKGYAVRTGLLSARGENRVFTDVDLAYGFDDVLRIAETLRSGSPVAIASREHPESEIILPPRHLGYAYKRRIQSRLFNWVTRRMLPITQRDTQAGLKGMNAQTANEILPRLTCNGFGFDCEILTACSRLNIEVTEVPVRVRYEDSATTTKATTTLKMLRELRQIRKYWPKAGPWPESVETSKFELVECPPELSHTSRAA